MVGIDVFRDISLPARSERPAYRALAEAIKARIRAGFLRPGESLPASREIADVLNVNIYTVQHAKNLLIRDRYLTGGQGKPTVVANWEAEPRSPERQEGTGQRLRGTTRARERGESGGLQLRGTIRAVESAPDGVVVSLQLHSGQVLRLITSQAALAWLHLSPGQTATIALEETGIHLTKPGEGAAS